MVSPKVSRTSSVALISHKGNLVSKLQSSRVRAEALLFSEGRTSMQVIKGLCSAFIHSVQDCLPIFGGEYLAHVPNWIQNC